MIKKPIAYILLLTVGLLFGAPSQTAMAASPALSAPAVVVINPGSNRLVFSKTPHGKRAPASTTKILTAMVTLDHMPLHKIVTVPKYAESVEPSKIYLKGGEKYRVRDLIKAILLSSANDAAETLAIAVGGSRAKFSKMLNAKVRAIGGRNSNFIRASGLPAKGQYSTAYDLALIAKHSQKYTFIIETMKLRTAKIRSLGGRRITLKNHNKMLWRDSREIIGKTGWTRKARHCFAGRIRINGRKMYFAIMGSHSLWRDIRRIVDHYFGSSITKVKTNKKLWSRNETKRIQLALKRAGYSPGVIDGKFGPRTVRAAEQFQKSKGLQVDGIVGSKTWNKLRAYL